MPARQRCGNRTPHTPVGLRVASRAERIGAYVLATGVFAGLTLAMAELAQFYIVHVLLLAWVVAEITTGVVTLALYRRGG